MVIKRLCFACTKSGKIVRFVLKNCTFRFRDYRNAPAMQESKIIFFMIESV